MPTELKKIAWMRIGSFRSKGIARTNAMTEPFAKASLHASLKEDGPSAGLEDPFLKKSKADQHLEQG